MVSVVGTATGGRNGSGSFTLTPPAGATSYLAYVTALSANLTPPSGWTLVGQYPLHSGGSQVSLYKGASAAGSSWSTTMGELQANYPVAAVIAGYDVDVDTSAVRVLESVSTTGFAPVRGAHGAGGVQVRLIAAQSQADATLTYPPQAPASRAQHKLSHSTPYTNYVGVAHSVHGDAGYTGEANWLVPDSGSGWGATTVGLYIPEAADPSFVRSSPGAFGATATVTASAASTMAGTVITPDDSRLTYPGAKSVYNMGSGWWRPKEIQDNDTSDMIGPYAVRMVSDVASFEVNFRQRSDLPFQAMRGITVRLKVDGQWVTDHPIYIGPGNTGYPPEVTSPTLYDAGSSGWFRVDFGSATTRTVEIWMMTEFAGIKVPGSATVSPAPHPGWTAVVIGDSLFAHDQYGTGQYDLGPLTYTYPSMCGPWAYACHKLGFDNVVTSASGASGYTLNGEATMWDNDTHLERDARDYDPQLIIVGTGLNDFGLQPSPDELVIGAAAEAVFDKLKADNPGAVVVAMGSPETTKTNAEAPGVVAQANGVYRTRAANAGVWYFDPKAGILYDETGTATSYQPGEAWYSASWESPDDIHPTQDGARSMGEAIAEMLAAILPGGDASAYVGATQIGGAFLGSTPVAAMYVGTTRVL